MQAAGLTQDYFGFFRQPAVPRTDAGTGKPQANRPRPSVLPAERVIEGELLRNRNASASGSLDQLLQRGRFANSAVDAPDTTITTPAAQRAINAYLDNSTLPASGGGGHSRSIDYYV
jgi:hypothetical protein